MSRRLTMNDYNAWSEAQRAKVRGWIEDHLGAGASATVAEIDLGESTASFVRIRMENGRPVLRLDGKGLAREIVTRPLKRPFPVEAS